MIFKKTLVAQAVEAAIDHARFQAAYDAANS